ncbi:uncharacterized protein LOC119731923 [Patiria miniata]|uniref:Uncharacterized protein n=1 Tax=Patiria miniata TaxID=46514 RepID=A0A914ACS9_PATMI|nr:uncharacterized protein LOC119731923 [Patiria miniata]
MGPPDATFTGGNANARTLNQGYSPSPVNRTRSSALGIDGFNDSQSADFELQPMLKIVLSQLEQHRILPVVRKEPSHLCSPPGGSPNGNICASNQDAGSRNWSLTEHDVTCVVDDVTAALSWLHDNGISGIHLNEDSILLDKDSNGQQRAYLQLPQSILGVDAPTSKLRESSADIGVELDNKAIENLIGRLRNNASLEPDEQKTQIDSGQLMTISHL